ncbi:MAG: flagellar filament capping protein FliD, partial [Planctomycetota bacterium]
EISKLLEGLTDSADGILEQQVQVIQDQIAANNRRIDQVDLRIESQRERLQREFNNLEFTLAGLQDQQAALNGLSSAQAQ